MGDPFPLSRIFVAAGRHRGNVTPPPEWLESELSRLDALGRSAWPHLALDAARFVAHVGRVTRSREQLQEALSTIRAEDLFLACACSEGGANALVEFDRVHLSRVAAFVHRIDASSGFADEVAQSIREAFLVRRKDGQSRIAEYSGRGPLASWVRVIAVRTALRLRRDRGKTGGRAEGGSSAEPVSLVDPELDYLKLRYREAFDDALRAALASLADRDALLLQLHYVDGLNIDRIGALYGMHRSTVARWRTAVRRRVLASTREHLRASMSLTDSEFDSIAALVRSQLTVSLRTALRRPD